MHCLPPFPFLLFPELEEQTPQASNWTGAKACWESEAEKLAKERQEAEEYKEGPVAGLPGPEEDLEQLVQLQNGMGLWI